MAIVRLVGRSFESEFSGTATPAFQRDGPAAAGPRSGVSGTTAVVAPLGSGVRRT